MPERFPNGFPGGGGRSEDPLADLRHLWEQTRERFGGGGGGARGGPSRFNFNPWFIVLIALVLYLLSGIYIVAPDERGIVLRFGKVVREADAGPGYHFPWPFERVFKPSVTQIRKDEFGFRTTAVGPPAQYRDVDTEALMLTGDGNIVKLQFIIQYKVKTTEGGATDFLFNVRDPERTMHDVGEAAMREIVGRNDIDDVLTEGKERIQEDTQVLLQQILDRYESGLEVMTVKLQDVDPPDQVSDAFKDVISAQQDKERLINEARGHANDIVPKARGQAAQMLNEAEGYAAAKVQDAGGQAQRFVALHDEYAKAKDVTRMRLYLETMEEVLPRVTKIVLDELAGKQVVPYLPLERAIRPPAAEAPEPPAGQTQPRR